MSAAPHDRPPQAAPYDVFISYAREDENRVAGPLADALAEAGLKVWIDSTEIAAGQDLEAKIRAGIDASRFFVPILSPAYLLKYWTVRELRLALTPSKDRADNVVPILHNLPKGRLSEDLRAIDGLLPVSTEDLDRMIFRVVQRVGLKEAAGRFLKHRARRDIRRSGVTALLCAALGLAWIQSPLGDAFALRAYHALQTLAAAAPSSRSVAPRATVVDISKVKPRSEAGGGQAMTPRPFLSALIKEIAEEGPAVIAVDIDLSPDESQVPLPGSFEFFDVCLETTAKTGVPILLGVGRHDLAPPPERLGWEGYASMAASVSVPKERLYRFPFRYEVEKERSILSLPAAAALAHPEGRDIDSRQDSASRPKLVTRLHKARPIPRAGRYVRSVFFVDYASLDAIMSQRTIRAHWPANGSLLIGERERSRRLIRANVVFVGDASDQTPLRDTAIPPGEMRSVPGVFIHACAADTLIDRPLFKLNAAAGVAAYLLVGLPLLMGAHLARWRLQSGGRYGGSPLSVAVTAAAAAVLGVALWLLSRHRVLWLGAPTLCALLILQHLTLKFASGARWRPASWLRRAASNRTFPRQ